MTHLSFFTFLHTADFHNRLSPAAARQLTELKRSHPGCLLLDAGDAIKAGNLGVTLSGEPILRQMAEIGYDAMALGNRESHPKRNLLMRKLQDASFPVLAANLVPQQEQLPPMIRTHLVFAGPPKVAVIGLAPQITRPQSVWAKVVDFVFEDPVKVVGKLARTLKDTGTLVVCLSHAGLAVDRMLAALPEVDLVLGGHSHRRLVEHEPGQALVVHPGWHASHVALTRLSCREDARSELLPLEQGS